ncbi:uncharacterized protein FFB20_01183 [Fusarium fujikuroi]|uniref:Uncharacterized protein n=1 Tax=Fusarium fujikuroi TaxID=5127 RepID=A0A0I9Y8Y4_FUSFU|nr:uncharacterized protein LW93_9006 [Fusarium fujikuroi]KLO92374.1 uncharacterized protein LW94_10959 [Fusarium fujikuroi]KLP12321.1 uncharacterized protein Y057_12032 [Fusarium fujikuroi]QGI68929.1 hypothetical protein CEK27_012900 [Fusarium fujikuroi]QGI86299.1 hypothetical protein CEK25_013028 [Fusarium fujikuroi]
MSPKASITFLGLHWNNCGPSPRSLGIHVVRGEMSPTRKRRRAASRIPRAHGERSHLQVYDVKNGKAPTAINDKSLSPANIRKKRSAILSYPPQPDALHQLLSVILVEQDIDEAIVRQADEGDLEDGNDSNVDGSNVCRARLIGGDYGESQQKSISKAIKNREEAKKSIEAEWVVI